MESRVDAVRPQHTQTARRRLGPRGATLIELMMVVALIGVFATMAQTSLTRLVPQLRESGSARSLAGLLQRARVDAVKSHLRVRVDVAGQVVSLSACPARYTSTGCATGTDFEPLVGARLAFDSDSFHGVKLTSPPTTLVFDAAGVPEQVTTYVFLLDATSVPSVRKVIVTAAGEVRRE